MKSVRVPLFVLLLLLAVGSSQASDAVLVPVFYGGPGALGSSWRTKLTIFNNSDQALEGIRVGYACGIPEGCHQALVAHSLRTLTAGDGFQYNTGFLLYPGISNADVSYSLRVYDVSAADRRFGAEIPVVPLDSFSLKELQLLDIPIDGRFRLTLRAYAIPPATARVRVDVVEDTEPTFLAPTLPPRVLVERFYDLQRPLSFPETGSFSVPAAVVVTDLLTPLPTDVSGQVRIVVQSVTPDVPIWAFATITNNETQEVAIATPTAP
jgi:hypothetical protein